jgi:hypothetical protein
LPKGIREKASGREGTKKSVRVEKVFAEKASAEKYLL